MLQTEGTEDARGVTDYVNHTVNGSLVIIVSKKKKGCTSM